MCDASPPRTQYSCTRGFFVLSAHSGAVHGPQELFRYLVILFFYIGQEAHLPTLSNSSTISFSGAAVSRLTTTMTIAEIMKAGSSS